MQWNLAVTGKGRVRVATGGVYGGTWMNVEELLERDRIDTAGQRM
jgi:hypothetical protein